MYIDISSGSKKNKISIDFFYQLNFDISESLPIISQLFRWDFQKKKKSILNFNSISKTGILWFQWQYFICTLNNLSIKL